MERLTRLDVRDADQRVHGQSSAGSRLLRLPRAGFHRAWRSGRAVSGWLASFYHPAAPARTWPPGVRTEATFRRAASLARLCRATSVLPRPSSGWPTWSLWPRRARGGGGRKGAAFCRRGRSCSAVMLLARPACPIWLRSFSPLPRESITAFIWRRPPRISSPGSTRCPETSGNSRRDASSRRVRVMFRSHLQSSSRLRESEACHHGQLRRQAPPDTRCRREVAGSIERHHRHGQLLPIREQRGESGIDGRETSRTKARRCSSLCGARNRATKCSWSIAAVGGAGGWPPLSAQNPLGTGVAATADAIRPRSTREKYCRTQATHGLLAYAHISTNFHFGLSRMISGHHGASATHNGQKTTFIPN